VIPIPTLEHLLDQFENIGGLDMFGPEGLTLLLALWRKSMKLAWARTFVMTNTELIYKSGLKNRESLNNHRNKLVQAGLIHYKPPAKGKSDGTYTLEFDLMEAFKKKVVKEPVSVADNLTDNLADNLPYNLPYNLADNFPDTIDRKIDSLSDGRIEICARDNDPWEQLQKDFIATFKCMLSPQHYEMINGYLNDGMDIQVILLALEYARNNDATFPKYLWRILDTWLTNGIKTIEDYRRYMQRNAIKQDDGQVVNLNAQSKKRTTRSERMDDPIQTVLSLSRATHISI
jgi:DnaD/phage-associated family protein